MEEDKVLEVTRCSTQAGRWTETTLGRLIRRPRSVEQREKAAHHLDPSTGSLKSIFCHLVTKLIPPPTHPLSSNLAGCTFWEALFPLTDFGEIYLVSFGLILDIESVRCEDGDCYAKDADLQIRTDQKKTNSPHPSC